MHRLFQSTILNHQKVQPNFCHDSQVESGGHDAPEWGKVVCVVVLVFCTALFAGISDLLAESVQELNNNGISQVSTSESFSDDQGFLGVFFIGIFGNAAELINAVSFGLRDNIALSLEIGYAGTIQVLFTLGYYLNFNRQH